MDEARGAAGRTGSPPAVSSRVMAASRLLGTLRAGRMRVERLAEESLGFDALVRVIGAGAADDPLIDEVRRTQDLVETRLAVWRTLRGRGPLGPDPSTAPSADDAAPAPAAAERRGAAPPPERALVEDLVVIAPDDGTPPDGALPGGAAAEPRSAAEQREPAAADWLESPVGAPVGDARVDHPDDIATLRDEPDAGEGAPGTEPAPPLRSLAAAQRDEAAADAPGRGASLDEPADDLDEAERTLDLEPPEDRLQATDLDLTPIDDELDTLHEDDGVMGVQLDAPEDGDVAGASAPPPRLAPWLTDDADDADDIDDDDDAGLDGGEPVAAVRVPEAVEDAADGEAVDDDPTRDPTLGEPVAVAARIALAPDDDEDGVGDEVEDEVTGELTELPVSQPTEGVTNELAAAPASDDFLFDEDVSSSVGLHVAFERPDEPDDGDLEPEEEDAGPRLTDDAPVNGYADAGDFDDELALEQVEDVDEALYARFLEQAHAAERRGDLVGAIQAYGDSIDLAPDRLEPFLGRGRANLELGDYAAAMSDFQRAEDLALESPEPLIEMGNLYFARKEYGRAIGFYDQALDIDPSQAMARCRRGICHHYRRNHRAAFQDLQKAYAIDPEIPNIRRYVQMAVKAMERDRQSR